MADDLNNRNWLVESLCPEARLAIRGAHCLVRGRSAQQDSLDDPRLEIRIQGARGYLANRQDPERFDLIPLDLTDLWEAAAELYQLPFWQLAGRPWPRAASRPGIPPPPSSTPRACGAWSWPCGRCARCCPLLHSLSGMAGGEAWPVLPRGRTRRLCRPRPRTLVSPPGAWTAWSTTMGRSTLPSSPCPTSCAIFSPESP